MFPSLSHCCLHTVAGFSFPNIVVRWLLLRLVRLRIPSDGVTAFCLRLLQSVGWFMNAGRCFAFEFCRCHPADVNMIAHCAFVIYLYRGLWIRAHTFLAAPLFLWWWAYSTGVFAILPTLFWFLGCPFVGFGGTPHSYRRWRLPLR